MRKLCISLCCLLFCRTAAWAQAPQAPLADRNYADLLSKSLRFFDAQACGPNASTYSSFDWRGACHVNDGNTVIGESATYDLTGGWHDAGDHVKFNYPMAFAVYSVASLYVDYRAQIDASGNREALLKHLRFVGDYMIKCHPEPNKYAIQVATGERDHRVWQVPEASTYERRAYFADLSQPNTNLACSNAAAFAALSMAFDGVDDSYGAELLQHARDLYDFGYQNQRSYNANTELPSYEFNLYDDDNDFYDEIMIGAAWLYRATGEPRYRTEHDAAFASKGNYLGGWASGWGDHHYEAVYQMAKATGEAQYRDAIGRYVIGVIDGSEGSVSPGGMWYVGSSNKGFHLPATLSTASLAYQYADLVGSSGPNYQRLRAFAFSQVNYVLGDNPRGGSYVVDFGNNFPRITHHRSASAGDGDSPQDPRILTGALVMGPLGNDQYLDTRSEIKCTEPAVGNNAALALAATLMVKETGGTAPPPPSDAQTTYNNDGAPWAITDGTTLQAEDYDEGGQGVAYQDNTPTSNAGGRYRTEGADIGVTPNGNTTFVGWIQAGEWLEYTVDVTEGPYDIQVSMASPNDDRTLRLKLGDQTLGTLDCPNSSTSFADFQTATLAGVMLPAGEQVLRLEMVDGSFNIDAISFVRAGGSSAGNVTIRAKGSTGSEQMSLLVDGQAVQSWTLATTPSDYTYEGYTGGALQVTFDNDGTTASGADRNLAVNYVEVCGTPYESNATGVVRTGCGVDNDQGFAWLWCQGSFDFGNLSCSSSAAALRPATLGGQSISTLSAYPNPASEQLTVVAASQDYQVSIYDTRGQVVMRHDHLQGTAQLDIRHLRPGVYVVNVNTDNGPPQQQRLVVE